MAAQITGKHTENYDTIKIEIQLNKAETVK